MKQNVQNKRPLLLMLTALIWGVAFVAQSVGMEYVGPFTFNSVRFLIGSLVLLPMVLRNRHGRENDVLQYQENQENQVNQEIKENQESKENSKSNRNTKSKRNLWLGGLLCGLALCVASCLQQFGIACTTVGKAGFITAMYIVIVPLLSIFLGKKPGRLVWFGVALATVGLYFLCMMEGFSVGIGDLYVLACALVFSVHILLIDHFSPQVDGVALSCIQFLVSGLVAGVAALLWETPSISAILTAWAPVLYAGVLSSGVGYTLQIIGQKGVDPTVASLILSLESVFSVLAGWVLLHQSLSGRELMGCGFMAVAIVLAQLPEKKKS